jgi:ABC-type multidrug transport system ATPase subunit
MPGSFSLYHDLSVEENLKFFAAVFNTTVADNYELIKPIYSHIERFAGRRAGALSGGMKQKLALSCALVHSPGLLLLDEPNTGVDAVSRDELWKMLFKLRDEGITIVVSTPYMDEAQMCSRVALMQKGEVLSVDRPDRIVASYPHDLYEVRTDSMRALSSDLEGYSESLSAHRFGDSVHLSIEGGRDSEREIRDHLRGGGHSGIEIRRIEPTIEDSFIELMGGGREE